MSDVVGAMLHSAGFVAQAASLPSITFDPLDCAALEISAAQTICSSLKHDGRMISTSDLPAPAVDSPQMGVMA